MNRIVRELTLPGGQTLKIVQGDLTDEHVDAIVNAANSHLAHGGGVAGAIVRRGGRAIQSESDAWVRANGPASCDKPGVTSAGNLPCRYVIHAVGPVWGEGDEDAKLSRAVQSALRTADELGLESIALPAISTGIFGFPLERAAGVILSAIEAYFAPPPAAAPQVTSRRAALRDVHLVLYDPRAVEALIRALPSLPGASGDA